MENQNPTSKRQKADIYLSIGLPESTKPFFNKMSTANNMVSQIKKAGTKLAESENLNVTANGKSFNLTKAETASPNLNETIKERMNSAQRIHMNSHRNDGLDFPTNVKAILSFEGEYNGVYQKLSVARDDMENFYTTDNLEYSNKDGIKVVDAELTKWKSISNESFSRIDDEMLFKGKIENEILGFVSPVKQNQLNTDLVNVDLNLSDKQREAISEYFEYGKRNPDADLTQEQYSKIPDIIDNIELGKSEKFMLATEGLDRTSIDGTSYSITHDGHISKVQLDEQANTSTQLLSIRDVSYKSDIEKGIEVNKKNLNYLKDQIKYLGFGEDAEVHKELEKKLKSEAKEFSISIPSDNTAFKTNKVVFDLNFSKSANSDMTFLNRFIANLTNESRNTNLQHTFAVKQNGFTAKQAINLLEGRAVKTEITNPQSKLKEEAYVKLKLSDEKNENGNFKLQVYNKNYGVDASKIVDKSNLIFDNEKHKDITIKSLERGNVVSVKFKDKDKPVEGKAVLNPQYKTINLYDNNMKRLNTNAPVLDRSDLDDSKQQVKAQQNHSRKL